MFEQYGGHGERNRADSRQRQTGIEDRGNNDLFYPRFRVPKEIADLWLPTGLGKYAAFVGMAVDGPWRRRKR